jgi:hypothetical protein
MDHPTLRKTAMEVQRAHDLLGAFLLHLIETPGLARLPLDLDQVALLTARYSVLCWLLDHPNNLNLEFEEYLRSVEENLLDLGKVLIDTRHLNYPLEFRRGN